jgi:hypothetical protein
MDAPLAETGPFAYKFHQVAFMCPSLDALDLACAHYKIMGYDNWSFDTAVLVGTLRGEPIETVATMAFNYEALPMELEFLHYEGPSRHQDRARRARFPFISHMSVHVESIEEEVAKLSPKLGDPYHLFETRDHTNPAVRGIKRFREAIFDTQQFMGYDLKLIERIAW